MRDILKSFKKKILVVSLETKTITDDQLNNLLLVNGIKTVFSGMSSVRSHNFKTFFYIQSKYALDVRNLLTPLVDDLSIKKSKYFRK